MTVPQTHHGVCVTDIDQARSALASIGYTRVQPNAIEPLRYENTAEDQIGRWTCPDLGSPYRTHWVEHPGTGHQIDLIEIDCHQVLARPTEPPLSGDLTVVLALPGVDGHRAGEVLGPLFGQRVEITDGPPWATLHIAANRWRDSQRFLTELLDVQIRPVGASGSGDERFTLDGIGGRIDVLVSASTAMPTGLGKRYPGANHLRFLWRDLAAIEQRMQSGLHNDARWLIPPTGGFAFIAGPAGETIELFDKQIP